MRSSPIFDDFIYIFTWNSICKGIFESYSTTEVSHGASYSIQISTQNMSSKKCIFQVKEKLLQLGKWLCRNIRHSGWSRRRTSWRRWWWSLFSLTVSPSEFSLSYHMSLSNNTNFVRNIPPKLVRRATIQEKTFKKVTSYSLRVFIQADLWYKNKENIYTFKHWNNVVIHSTMSN